MRETFEPNSRYRPSLLLRLSGRVCAHLQACFPGLLSSPVTWRRWDLLGCWKRPAQTAGDAEVAVFSLSLLTFVLL